MKSFLKRIHRNSKSFTLVEVLIIVAIMGALAAVAPPNVTGYCDTVLSQLCQAGLRALI